jgi:hypothetical protein
MLFRLFLIVIVLYMGYRLARRVADYFLGPLQERRRKVEEHREVRQRPPDIEEARWEDVTRR